MKLMTIAGTRSELIRLSETIGNIIAKSYEWLQTQGDLYAQYNVRQL